jgi:hypothetical protein
MSDYRFGGSEVGQRRYVVALPLVLLSVLCPICRYAFASISLLGLSPIGFFAG